MSGLSRERRRRLRGLVNDPTVGRVSVAVFRDVWAALKAAEAQRDRLAAQVEAVRAYAESRAISCRVQGHDDRPWLDLLIVLDRAALASREGGEGE